MCLQKLWIIATKQAVRYLLPQEEIGLLKVNNEVDIEIICDWNGDEGVFVKFLLEEKWLEKRSGKFYIHDLDGNSAYISNYIKLKINGSAYAKRKAKKREEIRGDEKPPEGSPPPPPNRSPTGKETKGKVIKGNNKEEDVSLNSPKDEGKKPRKTIPSLQVKTTDG